MGAPTLNVLFVFVFIFTFCLQRCPTDIVISRPDNSSPEFPSFDGDFFVSGYTQTEGTSRKSYLNIWYSERMRASRTDYEPYSRNPGKIMLFGREGPYGTQVKISSSNGVKKCSVSVYAAENPVKDAKPWLLNWTTTRKYAGTETVNGVELEKWQDGDRDWPFDTTIYIRQNDNGPQPVMIKYSKNKTFHFSTFFHYSVPAATFKYDTEGCTVVA